MEIAIGEKSKVWQYSGGQFTSVEGPNWPGDAAAGADWLETVIRAGYESAPLSFGVPHSGFELEVYFSSPGREDVPAEFLVLVTVGFLTCNVLVPTLPDLLQLLALVTPVIGAYRLGRESKDDESESRQFRDWKNALADRARQGLDC